MGISETLFMLVYGGLFLFTLQLFSSNNKILVYIKSAFLIALYVFISNIIWFTFKGEESHTNNHSGYEAISFTGEAILCLGVFSIYNIILLLLGTYLRRKRRSVNP